MTNLSSGLRILFVSALVDPVRGGGVEHTLRNLTRALTDRGHRCILLTLSEQPGTYKVESNGVTVWTVGSTMGIWRWGKEQHPPRLVKRQIGHALTTFNPFIQNTLKDIIGEEGPDIVSFHNLTGWSVASWKTAAMSGVPAVQVLHDFLPICFHSVMMKEQKHCETPCQHCKVRRFTTQPYSKYLTGVVGVSRYILDRYSDLGYFNNVPVRRVIHNVRLAEQLGVGKVSPDREHGAPRFGYMGRLDAFKGVEQMIEAFREANIPRAELLIAGSGEKSYEEYLAQIAGPNVTFLGQVRPADFFPKVDVAIVPSICNEALGNVVYEALAFGKAVLASNRGGILEMIDDNVNGLLFNPENKMAFVDNLRRLAKDSALRKRLSKAAPESAARFLDSDLWVDRYEELYNAMITSQRVGH